MPMTKIFFSRSLWLPAAILACALSIPDVVARPWGRTPQVLAQDYSIINDNRGNGELVLIFWVNGPSMPKTANSAAMLDLLDKYTVIGVVHAKVSKEGTMSFDDPTAPQAMDQENHLADPMKNESLPPTVVGALAVMQSMFGRSLGALGAGVKWHTFEGLAAHSCSKGKLTVMYAGEKYFYDLPMPGCS
jgi:hypothetical protein